VPKKALTLAELTDVADRAARWSAGVDARLDELDRDAKRLADRLDEAERRLTNVEILARQSL
jgi:hypothetical protein